MKPCATGWVDLTNGEYHTHVHDATRHFGKTGAYWLCQIGIAMIDVAGIIRQKKTESFGFWHDECL